MQKELKQILLISLFLILGCLIGYLVAATQIKQLNSPEYIAFWTDRHMSVPEPIGLTRCMIAFGLLFSGIPTGLLFFSSIIKKWLTPAAPKMIMGLITFPIYTLGGAIGSIPFMIYKTYLLTKDHRKDHKRS